MGPTETDQRTAAMAGTRRIDRRTRTRTRGTRWPSLTVSSSYVDELVVVVFRLLSRLFPHPTITEVFLL